MASSQSVPINLRVKSDLTHRGGVPPPKMPPSSNLEPGLCKGAEESTPGTLGPSTAGGLGDGRLHRAEFPHSPAPEP